MAAAFARLEIPHVYAMLFYLSVFIGGLMFVVSYFGLLESNYTSCKQSMEGIVSASVDWLFFVKNFVERTT